MMSNKTSPPSRHCDFGIFHPLRTNTRISADLDMLLPITSITMTRRFYTAVKPSQNQPTAVILVSRNSIMESYNPNQHLIELGQAQPSPSKLRISIMDCEVHSRHSLPPTTSVRTICSKFRKAILISLADLTLLRTKPWATLQQVLVPLNRPGSGVVKGRNVEGVWWCRW